MTNIQAWSFSGLLDYEACPRRAKFRYIDKFKTESHPAAARGTAIHDLAEKYVKGELEDLPKELGKFVHEFHEWKQLYTQKLVRCEEDWGATHQWMPTGFFDEDVWWRGKLDLCVLEPDKKHATVIDHKTGKRFGNEVKHAQQGQLYAFATFMMLPEYETVSASMCYLDLGEWSRTMTYTREQAAKIGARFISRAERMTTDTTFVAKPNKFNCRWCNYKEHCDVAVDN
jgi:RecB family exonuclease